LKIIFFAKHLHFTHLRQCNNSSRCTKTVSHQNYFESSLSETRQLW